MGLHIRLARLCPGVLVIAVAGCAAAPARTNEPVPASPTLTAPPSVPVTPSPPAVPPSVVAFTLPEPRGAPPVVRYPASEGLGRGLLVLTHPAAVAAMPFWLTCEWPDTSGVHWLYVDDTVSVAGERVVPDLSIDVDRGTGWIQLPRGPLASYYPDKATSFVVTHAPDYTSGRVAFEGLRPNIQIGTGPIPTPEASYGQPLGGDPAYASLDGTVSWECGAAPPGLPSAPPAQPSEPEPTLAPLPNAILQLGSRRIAGSRACGTDSFIGGTAAGEDCGPSFQALPTDKAVTVHAGDLLHFELTAGTRWQFTSFSFGGVAQAEAERYRGEQPPSFRLFAKRTGLHARAVSLSAPKAGDWSILLAWSAVRGPDGVDSGDFFRLHVVP